MTLLANIDTFCNISLGAYHIVYYICLFLVNCFYYVIDT